MPNLAADSNNLMSFRNHGGLLNSGVCWWHSRFQRNALYLTLYKPELAKPNVDEAILLIKRIRDASSVVIIPGYENFRSFSSDFEPQIQRELEKWQKGDGFIRFAWIDGLSGKLPISAETLQNKMDKMYEVIQRDHTILYNKLEIPSIEAHAWLVVGMDKTENGYNLNIIDSNFPNEIQTYNYHIGDKNFTYYANLFTFVPNLEGDEELTKIQSTMKTFCQKSE